MLSPRPGLLGPDAGPFSPGLGPVCNYLPWWRRQFPLSGHVLSKQMAHHWGTSLKFSSLFIMISFPSNGLILKSGCKDTTFFNWFHDLSHVGEILNSMVSDYQGVTRRKKLPCHSCHYWCHSENAVKQSHSRLCGMSGIKVVLLNFRKLAKLELLIFSNKYFSIYYSSIHFPIYTSDYKAVKYMNSA